MQITEMLALIHFEKEGRTPKQMVKSRYSIKDLGVGDWISSETLQFFQRISVVIANVRGI